MMQWIYGNLFLFSIIGVVCGLLGLYGWIMWQLGMPPDDHRILNAFAGILAMFGGYWYFLAVIKLVKKLSRPQNRP